MTTTHLRQTWPYLLVGIFLLTGTFSAQAQSSFYREAVQLQVKGETSDAIDYYTLAIQENASNTDAFFKRAQAYLEIGKLRKAQFDLDELLYLQPEHVNALLTRGNVLLELGETQLAYQDYARAIALQPSVHGYVYMGEAAKEMGNYQDAIRCFESALQMNWRCAEAFCGKGDIYAALEHNNSALANYNTALAYNPSDVVTLYNRGQVYWKIGQVEQAIADFTMAVNIERDVDSYIARALCYLQQGSVDLALIDVRSALQLDANDAGVYVALGLAEIQQDKYAEARESFDIAKELQIENPIYWKYIGRSFYRLDDPFSAAEALGKYLDVMPAEEVGEELLMLQKCHEAIDLYAQKQEQEISRPGLGR